MLRDRQRASFRSAEAHRTPSHKRMPGRYNRRPPFLTPARMPYRLIAFDFDGTLADSFDAFVDALNAAATKHGFHRLEGARLAQARGASARDVMRLLHVPLWKAPAITLEMRQQMRERIAQTQLFDGVADTLGALAGRGVRLAIATSNAEDNVRAVLGPATRWVHHYSCGISVFGKARKLAALTASTRVRPEDVLYVGDEMRDADAARAAGIAFRGVAWGYTAPDALQRHAGAPLLRRPEDLLAL
ncbi:Phosphoglycolate phosphatase [Ralstonia mannitolilytica]|uniref:Phosphoglycolate phosphatase n=2 Tax=Ralstonia mannitolilytica TaxID=105219 RepID=A0AAD2ALM7_9RALS|nr:Phosphoglycolate phosphatase [Ralstonia mannitolilytica]CAJ0864608.1 Phosphoglycolate phosphatase [Ralstonia mannitolilytica]